MCQYDPNKSISRKERQLWGLPANISSTGRFLN